MKLNTIIISSCVLALVSCSQVNSQGEKTITQNGDTISDVEISLSKTDALVDLVEKIEASDNDKLLFKAHGSEPGWYTEVYNSKLKLVVDYGKDSVLLNHHFNDLENSKGFSYTIDSLINGKKVVLSLVIKNVPCVAESGDKEDRTVLVKLNNQMYKGCGSFVK